MTFKPTDTVVLEMTVIHIENNKVFTTWTEDGILKQGEFSIDAIKPKPEDNKLKKLTPNQLENFEKILSLNE